MLWECLECDCEFLEFEPVDDDNSMRPYLDGVGVLFSHAEQILRWLAV